MKQTEKIRRQWEKAGYYVINLIHTNKKGIPDYLCIKENEKNVFVESKEEWDTLKPLQRFRIDELLSKGNRVFVNGTEQFKEIILCEKE